MSVVGSLELDLLLSMVERSLELVDEEEEEQQ